MKHAIGIIANPASGKDIRRLVAYGTTSDNVEKVNMIRRVIMGACAMGVTDLYYMPDYFGIVTTAMEGMYSDHQAFVSCMQLHPLDMVKTGTEADSTRAAKLLRELGVDCVIVLGGDGTSRAVAREIGSQAAVIPISTGTNNVFPRHLEGTIAGMAAGAYVSGKLQDRVRLLQPSKRLDIYRNGELVDIALIDAVVIDDQQIASRAMWTPDNFSQILLTRCAAHNIGISSIGGQLMEISEEAPVGCLIEVGRMGRQLRAPIAPGLFATVYAEAHREIPIGGRVDIRCVPCVIAVDGERNVNLFEGDTGCIELTWNGPQVLRVEETLRAARDAGVFQTAREA